MGSCALVAMLGGCQNPAEVARLHSEDFHRELPQNLVQYPGSDRQMSAAWSGSPQNPPIIFVHGSPGSWDGWAEFLMSPKLTGTFHLLAVDRPGFGKSEPGKTERSLALQASNIAKVLDLNQSGKKAILVGHSFGGPVIARIAMDYPNRVAAMVFVSSSVDPALETTKWYQYPAEWFVFRWMVPTSLRVCNEEIRALKSELEEMVPLWKKIEMTPTVILHGSDDDLVPVANADFIARRIHPASLVSMNVVEGLNHFIPWKRADLVFDAIAKVSRHLAPTQNKAPSR